MSLAFIDPGNIEADLQSGAFTGFSLGYVLLLAHVGGLVIQSFASRLGAVTGNGLARICRDHYPHYLNLFLWLMTELAIIASDIQEVIGSAIALNLLFNIPLWQGVVWTGISTLGFLVLYLYKGLELIELIIMGTIVGIFVCFALDLVESAPDVSKLVTGLVVPRLPGTAAEATQMVALIGSVIMPHNCMLHSSLVGKKSIYNTSPSHTAQAIKYFVYDALVALSCSFLINLSLQSSFAQGFYSPVCAQNPSGPLGCDPTVTDVTAAIGCSLDNCACTTPCGLVGVCSEIGLSNAGNALSFILPKYATVLFGLGLLAAGQASTVSGTMAGQYVMEGFMDLKVSFWLRMLITRGIALIPAIGVSLLQSEFSAMNNLSQSLNVLQSVQLPFALLPLLHFCGTSHIMGKFRSRGKIYALGWTLAVFLISVNGYLLVQNWSNMEPRWRVFLSVVGCVYVSVVLWVIRADTSPDEGTQIILKDHQIVHCDYHRMQT
jgi:NRAMP (natural resistance-associated macrophage protein)-like metal ion transporter